MPPGECSKNSRTSRCASTDNSGPLHQRLTETLAAQRPWSTQARLRRDEGSMTLRALRRSMPLLQPEDAQHLQLLHISNNATNVQQGRMPCLQAAEEKMRRAQTDLHCLRSLRSPVLVRSPSIYASPSCGSHVMGPFRSSATSITYVERKLSQAVGHTDEHELLTLYQKTNQGKYTALSGLASKMRYSKLVVQSGNTELRTMRSSGLSLCLPE